MTPGEVLLRLHIPHWTIGSRRSATRWRVVAAVEVVLAVVAVLADVLIPTLVLLVLATLSLAARREWPTTLGLVRVHQPGRLLLTVLGLTVVWTFVQIGVIIPVLEQITGRTQDLSQFDDLQGNVPLLLVLLGLSWTLAAFGEELAYRGYLQARLVDVLGPGRSGLVLAILLSSVVFGLAHTEQGVVGVAATALDGVFFALLMRLSASGLWAAVLAHGLSNTIGLTATFLVGPIHGLW